MRARFRKFPFKWI